MKSQDATPNHVPTGLNIFHYSAVAAEELKNI